MEYFYTDPILQDDDLSCRDDDLGNYDDDLECCDGDFITDDSGDELTPEENKQYLLDLAVTNTFKHLLCKSDLLMWYTKCIGY